MIDFLVSNGDLVLGSNTASNSAGFPYQTTTAISQRVYLTFTCWLGDWFIDLTFGVDYKNFKAPSKESADILMQKKLLSIDGVTGIVTFTSDLNVANRYYSFRTTYTTTDSPINILNLEI